VYPFFFIKEVKEFWLSEIHTAKKFIFALSPNDIDDLCKLYEKAGGINESEQEQITTAPRGQTFAIMSPSSRTTFQIEVPSSVVQMFKKPDFVSQYFVGDEGEKYWEEFIGSSRLNRLENKMTIRSEKAPEEQLPHHLPNLHGDAPDTL
jgi:hypothetical protein